MSLDVEHEEPAALDPLREHNGMLICTSEMPEAPRDAVDFVDEARNLRIQSLSQTE